MQNAGTFLKQIWILPTGFSQNSAIPSFTEIRHVGAALIHGGRRTVRQT